jgi:3-oxoacyl-[acyl-carrier protein] reductase
MVSEASFLHGRHVVLTGAGRAGQVGEAVAAAFAEHGALMILVDRDPERAAARAAPLVAAGHQAHALGCDLASPSAVASFASSVGEICGSDGLAALINAAGGFAMSGNVADSDLDVWEKQFSVNLRTCYLSCRAMLPLLRKGRGSIVNFATGAALPNQPVARMSAYVAAKSGVVVLTRAIAQEEKDTGVRANAIAPTAVRTAANLESMGSDFRYVEREEVAATALFLCSPQASAISGEVIRLA